MSAPGGLLTVVWDFRPRGLPEHREHITAFVSSEFSYPYHSYYSNAASIPSALHRFEKTPFNAQE